MRRDDRTWQPDLPVTPAPLAVWGLTAVFLALIAGAYAAFRLLT